MIAYTIGRILIIVAAAMLVPMILSLFFDEGIAGAYLIPILISLALGAAFSIRQPENKSLFVREGMVIVGLSWIIISVIGGLPFFISRQIPNVVDCFFETVSGFTTTGSTILTDVESMSKSLLFWRSFTHWLGGMGVLVFAMAIFSSKDTRATYMMKAEMPGPVVGKLTSKWQFSVRILYMIYIALTVLETVFLLFGGMPLFDSVVHAFGTAGTGGFGIKNNSIAYYGSPYIEYVIAIFMTLFGVNFNIYYLLIIRKFSQIKENDELKWYFIMMAAAVALISVNIYPIYNSISEAFRYSFFQVSTVMTTTGYATADFTDWPMLSQMILFMLMFVGACAGSTGGGMKIIRLMILAKVAKREVRKAASPRSVFSVHAAGKTVELEILHGVLAYFVIYMLCAAVSMVLVSLDNMSFTTTATSVISVMNNIGPGLGDVVGPSGNFSSFSNLSKIVMSFDMLIGRLEFYPILIMFSPYMWKKT